jgi:copper chaperone NosL
MRAFAAAALMVCGFVACSPATPEPATLDTKNEACGNCRMKVSNIRFASQIVAPGETPVFFDDLGCFSQYLKERTSPPAGAVAYVADHRTSDWVRASEAVFTRVPAIQTPMNSHLIAHATDASRAADPAAKGGENVVRADLAPWLGQAGSR